MRRQTKIVHDLFKILIVTLLMVVLETIIYLGINDTQEKMMDTIVERNEMASCMHIVMQRMENNVHDVLEGITDSFELYRVNDEKLENYLTFLKKTSASREVSMNLLNQIETMHATLTELKKEAQYEAVITQLEGMRGIVEILVVEDLQTTKDEYDISMGHFRAMRTALFGGMALTILLAFLFIVRTIQKMSRQINQIQTEADELMASNWKSDIHSVNYEELNVLATTLNSMKEQINLQFHQIEEKNQLELSLQQQKLENEKKDRMLITAQINYLKNQINPHFMFNALNIIGKSVVGNPEKAMELIESFSAILRYSLYNENRTVTIKEDLKIVEDFLKIQKSRFTYKLDYHIEMEESIEEWGLLPMLIQPIVENSIKHGRFNGDSIKVDILARQENGIMVITVKDNGHGFDVNRINERTSTTGLGLINVKQRIEMEYGENGSMHVSSVIGKGTLVEFRLKPVKAGVKDADSDC